MLKGGEANDRLSFKELGGWQTSDPIVCRGRMDWVRDSAPVTSAEESLLANIVQRELRECVWRGRRCECSNSAIITGKHDRKPEQVA